MVFPLRGGRGPGSTSSDFVIVPHCASVSGAHCDTVERLWRCVAQKRAYVSLLSRILCEFARTNRLELCGSASLRTLYNAESFSVSASRFRVLARASATVAATSKIVVRSAFSRCDRHSVTARGA